MDEVGVTMVTVAGVHDEVRLVDLQHGRGRRNHGNGSRSARWGSARGLTTWTR